MVGTGDLRFYGSTESGAVTFANSEDALKKPGTVGRIAPGAELRFVGDNGHILPQGQIGQIYSRIAGNPDFTYHNKRKSAARSIATVLSPRAMSAISTPTAMSSSATASATW